MIKKILFSGVIGCFNACSPVNTDTKQEADNGWESLFNGNDLSGWEQVNGSAPYKVEDGAIVGTTVMNSPNSFLASTN